MNCRCEITRYFAVFITEISINIAIKLTDYTPIFERFFRNKLIDNLSSFDKIWPSLVLKIEEEKNNCPIRHKNFP